MDARILEADRLSLDGEPEEHNFVEGKWFKNGRYHYETRVDTCSKCECTRHMVRSKHTNHAPLIAGYGRSMQIFNPDEMPQCWGSPNP